MSRIGKQPVNIPSGVSVTLQTGEVIIKGSKGELRLKPHPRITVVQEGNTLLCQRKGNEKLDKSLHGLTRTLLNNMMAGVTQGFSKKLEVQGIGYRAQLQGKKLQLSLGFSHPVDYEAPEGIHIEIDKEKKNIITVSGPDKQLVGQVAAIIRSFRPPEPYKGKGIRYVGEVIIKKAGKAAATAGAGAGGK